MKRCKKCGFGCLSIQDKCLKCGTTLDGIKNISTVRCSKCDHHRSMMVTLDKNNQELCFGCYTLETKRSYFQSKEMGQWGSGGIGGSLKFERLALLKMNEARYYHDDEMFKLADRVYVLANDMKNQTVSNEELYAELPSLAQQLINH